MLFGGLGLHYPASVAPSYALHAAHTGFFNGHTSTPHRALLYIRLLSRAAEPLPTGDRKDCMDVRVRVYVCAWVCECAGVCMHMCAGSHMCVRECACICVCAGEQVCRCVYIHVCGFARVRVCVGVRCVHVYVCVQVSGCVYMYAALHACVHVYMCVHVSGRVCM